jgi:hypothetical protein
MLLYSKIGEKNEMNLINTITKIQEDDKILNFFQTDKVGY